MNNEVACPINFTEEELKTHYQGGEGWNEQAAGLRMRIRNVHLKPSLNLESLDYGI
jgi:hypothetical protein